MPVTPTYPGVYIQEIPSGVRTIVGVATSVTAFVGRALWGPVNEPITINNFGDYERIFGGMWTESTMSYAVRDFFQNGGAQAIIIRLYNPTYDTEGARQIAFTAARVRSLNAATAVRDAANGVVGSGAAAIKAAASTAADIQIALNDVAAAVAADYILNLIRDTADGPRPFGEVGTATTTAANALIATANAAKTAIGTMCDTMLAEANVPNMITKGQDAITAEANTYIKGILQAIVNLITPPGTTKPNATNLITAAKTTEMGKQDTIIAAVTAVQNAVIAEIANPNATLTTIGTTANSARDSQSSLDPAVAPFVSSLAQSVNAATISPPDGSTIVAAATAALNAAADAGANAFAPQAKAILEFKGLKLVAKYEGAWGNKIRARITTDTESRKNGTDPKSFNLFIRDDNTGKVESFLEVSTNSTKPRYVNEVLKGESLLVTNENTPTVVTCSEPAVTLGVVAEREAWTNINSTPVPPDKYGSDGDEIETVAFTESRTDKKGIYALEKVELFNMLCIPPRTFSSDLDTSVIDKAIAYCVERRAVMIVDPSSAWVNKDLAKTGMASLSFDKSDHAAMYFPKLRAKDSLRGNRVMDFAPCGVVAGIIARTDNARGIWKAPAGLDASISGYPEVAVNLTDAENGELNPLGLNCIRSNAAGRIVWGARTLRGDDRFASEYKYLPIRRLALHIENSLYRGMQWVVFEPNDEPLWAQIRLNVGAFMHGLFRQGAFEGKSPSEAYFVKCDSETTTATDRNLGVVNILVGFAPLKPAEFVVISLQQIAKKDS